MHVTCEVRNSHLSSLYKGCVTLSKTHSPVNKSQSSGGNSTFSSSSSSKRSTSRAQLEKSGAEDEDSDERVDLKTVVEKVLGK